MEDLSGKVGFIPAIPAYKVRWDQNEDHVEYVVLSSSNMKDMARILGDVMKPEANEHVFCSAPQFSFLAQGSCFR